MKVFGHNDVGEEGEAGGTTGSSSDPQTTPFRGVDPKHGKAIPGYGGDEKAGRVLVDRGHGGGRPEA